MPTEGLVDYICEVGYPPYVRDFKRKLKTISLDRWTDSEIIALYHPHSFSDDGYHEGPTVSNGTPFTSEIEGDTVTVTIRDNFDPILAKEAARKAKRAGCTKMILDLRNDWGGDFACRLDGVNRFYAPTEKVAIQFDTGRAVLPQKFKYKGFISRVLVRVSRHTVSSGEILAAVFIGRRGCRIQYDDPQTGGFLSVNAPYQFRGVDFVLTIGRIRTAGGKLLGEALRK